MDERFDLIVLGGGSAGYAAARAAAEMGASVAVAELGRWAACASCAAACPARRYLHPPTGLYHAQHAAVLGIHVGAATPDLPAIIARKRRLIKEFADYRIEQLSTPDLTLVNGAAQFLSAERVQVGERVLTAPKFVIATGLCAFPRRRFPAGGSRLPDER